MSDNNYRDIQQFALNVRKDVAKSCTERGIHISEEDIPR